MESDAALDLDGLAGDTLAQITQHGRAMIDARDANAVARDRQRDATVADAVLEHLAAVLRGE